MDYCDSRYAVCASDAVVIVCGFAELCCGGAAATAAAVTVAAAATTAATIALLQYIVAVVA